MIPVFKSDPVAVTPTKGSSVHCFGDLGSNLDEATVRSFGEEWEKFTSFAEQEIEGPGQEYFDIVPSSLLGSNVQALDVGCGSGRWTRYLASRVGHVHAVDPSQAVFHAAAVNRDLTNVTWSQAGVDTIPFEEKSFDLIICLGVLHHIPDTAKALATVTKQLKDNGHFLLYLYYALDGRGLGYRSLFKASGRYASSCQNCLEA